MHSGIRQTFFFLYYGRFGGIILTLFKTRNAFLSSLSIMQITSAARQSVSMFFFFSSCFFPLFHFSTLCHANTSPPVLFILLFLSDS